MRGEIVNYCRDWKHSSRAIKQFRPTRFLVALVAVSILFPRIAQPQASVPQPPSSASSDSARRPTSTPYTGDLSIFETPDRDKKLQVERVMDLLNIYPGSTVADIGAGSGWFSVRAAKRVGEQGTVYAVDINPDAIKYIDSRIQKNGIHNVRTVLSSPDDPKLSANSVDSVLILKTYHEIAEPVRLLKNVRKALRPGARVGIIDRNGNGEDHGIEKQVVEQEAARAGFHVTGDYDFVKADREDYFLVLEVKQ